MTFKTRKIQSKNIKQRTVHPARQVEVARNKKPASPAGKQETLLRQGYLPARSRSFASAKAGGGQARNKDYKKHFTRSQRPATTQAQPQIKTQIIKPSHYQPSAHRKRTPHIKKDTQVFNDRLRIIPLGGCEEVGRNMTVFELGQDIVIIDMGMQFPEEDQPGIDYIIPNTDYLKDKEKNIRAVVFTHGHLDHIGAVPLLMEKLGNPLLIGSKLTIEMIKARQEDYKKGSIKNLKIQYVESFKDTFKLGKFKVKLFPVSHSIMDAVGIILETPYGTVIHPGDWKLERDPRSGELVTYHHLSKLKRPKILMLESLGMNYETPPLPEKVMYATIEKLIAEAKDRIIIGTFSSNVDRIAVILEMAQKYNRKVAIDGFSMKKNIGIAKKLGYIKFNLKNLIDIKSSTKLPDNQVIIMGTGAQGEDRAVLNRIANGEHRFIKFKKSDTVIFSSSVIPGNERSVQRLKDLIYRQSDHVIHSNIMDVHSGGHATASDIAEVIKQIRPDYFIPVYANHYMLKEAANLARTLGYRDKNIFVPDNGSIIEFGHRKARMGAKKVMTDAVMVDGFGVSDSQSVVLRDRQILAEDGMVVVIATLETKKGNLVNNPDIISRGFVYLKENRELLSGIRKKIRQIVEASQNPESPVQDDYLRNKIRSDIGQYLFSKTGKRPMVLPVVIEV